MSRLFQLRRLRWGQAFCLASLLIWSGCARPSQRADPKPKSTAEDVMEQLLHAYRGADCYHDNALVRLQYHRNGKSYKDEAPLAVRWQAPNQLNVRAYQAEVVCDGTQLMARIHDEATGDFDGQVVVRPAPDNLTLDQLWGEDEILSLSFRQGLAGYPIQMDLLLSNSPLAALRTDNARQSLLAPRRLGGRVCHRLKVDTDDGTFILWVDQEDFVVRRVEYPAATFAPEVARDESVDNARLTVECPEASFEPPASPTDMFAVNIPSNAKRVKQLIPLPNELPSDLFGKKATPYQFKLLSGESFSNQSLGDRIKVLVWFNNHPACESTVQQLNQVYQQYQDQDNVAIRAICVAGPSFDDQKIRALIQGWRVDVPVARDPHAVGRDLFNVPWAPTLVVLDGQDVVQIYEVGANPNLVAELPQVLEQLLAGDDVAGTILDQFQKERSRYERALQRGRPLPSSEMAEDPATRSPTSPQVLQIKPLWTNESLEETGNVLAIQDSQDETRFLVHEGWRTITEISDEGTVLARHELNLPARAAITQLKSRTDANGHRYYVAWSRRNPQVHVFDGQWKRVLSYPARTEDAEVEDAMLSDLDGDGQLELQVGFWKTAGVHCVSLSGGKLWENQETTHVLSLMKATPVNGHSALWVSSASGHVTQLDRHGRGTSLDQHTGQLTHQLFRAPSAEDSSVPYCAISYGLEGRRLALGLGPEGDSKWRYSLPAGAFAAQVRFVTSARLLDENTSHWLIAGANGSLHIISQDGRMTDHFQVGQNIAGLAGGRHDSAGILVVSHQDGLQAWQVFPPTTASNTTASQE
ncbi:MAG: hypothetical protein R6U98_26880 [Pirellulaceae bacterium]